MAVKLRLKRLGRKKRPIYAVVAADARSPRDGRIIEDLGRYRPLDEQTVVNLNGDRMLHWLENGAQPTETVRSILSDEGILLAMHMRRKGKSEDEITEAVAAHRTHREEKAGKKVTLTSKQRRMNALAAEGEKFKAEEAKRAKLQAEAEAKARAAAEEAKRKQQEELQKEREAAAIAALAEQEKANAVQAADDQKGAKEESAPKAENADPATK